MKTYPLAYLITFTCYGTRMHGNAGGSVDRLHNTYGSPFVAPDANLEEAQGWDQSQSVYHLDVARAQVALDAMVEVARHRRWELIAGHLMTSHVHLVAQANVEPEKVVGDMKSYASRSLTTAGFEDNTRKRWTRGGSARYLWTPQDVENAVQYVLHGQLHPMVVYDPRSSSPVSSCPQSRGR
jgi:REP element-mobilizing transposase RayT